MVENKKHLAESRVEGTDPLAGACPQEDRAARKGGCERKGRLRTECHRQNVISLI